MRALAQDSSRCSCWQQMEADLLTKLREAEAEFKQASAEQKEQASERYRRALEQFSRQVLDRRFPPVFRQPS